MKISREPKNRNGTRIRRCIGLLLTSCFFLGVVAFAMHHHNVAFQFKSCTICKAKASFLGTLNKVKADLPVSIETVNHSSAQIYFTFCGIKYFHHKPFISSLLPNPLLNKAPPFRA
jgi:hypothetical protein